MVRSSLVGADRIGAALVLALGLPAAACGARTFDVGGDGGESGSAAGDRRDDGRPAPFACNHPRPVPGDVSASLVACEGNWQHRTNEFYCPADPALGGVLPPTGCETDADCAAGQLCECGRPAGVCVTATCRLDSECGAAKLCALYVTPCSDRGYACQTSTDECIVDSDCPRARYCKPAADGSRRRECKPVAC